MYSMYGLGQEGGVTLSLVYNQSPPVREVEWLASVMTEDDRAAFRAHFCEEATRTAFDNGDWETVAAAIWGGDDKRITSNCGRMLALWYLGKDRVYNQFFGPGPEPMVAPPSMSIQMEPVRVLPKTQQDAPPAETGAPTPSGGGGGMSSGMMAALAALGIAGVVLGSKRRR